MMNIYSLFDDIPFNQASIITVGTFDGVHIGHQNIIAKMKEIAQSVTNSRTVIVTFHPHPQLIVPRKDKPQVSLLSTIEERIELIESYGIDTVIIIPFSKEFASTSSTDFIKKYIVEKIGVHTMCIGYDHGFGNNREGSEETLVSLSQECNFSLEIIPATVIQDRPISSTIIRKAIIEHQLHDSLELLGYPYFVSGIVLRGDERGRKLGIPTANIKSTDPHKLYPGNGVYFVSSEIDCTLYYGMANIGTRPTFTNDTESILEVNYFGLHRDLYDKTITVWFLHFLREEKKFDSVDLFLSQLYEDRAFCEELIEALQKCG